MDRQERVGQGLPYRAELDGLRGIAVLAVVLFHFRLGCHGGFVGVDLFFVLSGFLITSLILRDLNESRFSLVEFWERRIRRIAPALTVWVTATLVAGWWLFIPSDFERLGQAVVAQGLVLSNLFHGWKIDYFSPATESFPLLHTWSLAVEEQFYVVLPIFLMVVHRQKPHWIRPLLLISCLASFALAVWLTSFWARVSFWILPTRAWEMLLGSLLAAYPRLGEKAPRWLREFANWTGLTAIFASILFFRESIPFPGIATLVPTIGMATVIWANSGIRTLGGNALTWKPLVFLGKMSYSLYLIHWPVIAYADYWYRQEMNWPIRMALVLITILMSVISLFFIENPIRKGVWLPGHRPLFAGALVATLILMTGGYFVDRAQGVKGRFNVAMHNFFPLDPDSTYRDSMLKLSEVESGRLFEFGDKKSDKICLVWGDSHAMSMMPVLDDICRENGFRGNAALCSNLPPLIGFEFQKGMGSGTPRFNAAVLREAIDRKVRVAVITACWVQYASQPQFGAALKNTVRELTAAGIDVVLVRDVPMQDGYVPRLLVRATNKGQDVRQVGIPLEQHRQKNHIADDWLMAMAGPGVIVLDPAPFYTDESGLCRAQINGFAMYRDSAHITAEGARLLKPMFGTLFDTSRWEGPTAVSQGVDAPTVR